MSNYNRKEFLKTVSALTAGIAMSDTLVACNDNTTAAKENYGIQVYTVREDIKKNPEAALAYVAKAGYTQAELYGFDDVKTFWGLRTPKQVKKILDENGMVSPSCHYHLKGFMYEGKIDDWKAAVEASAILGNEYMIVPWVEKEYRSGEYYKKLVDLLGKASELTRAAGMKFAYHNHDFEFEKDADGNMFEETLLKTFTQEQMEFELDLYWVVYAGHNPVDWFKKYPGRFTMWHVKDLTTNKEGIKESTQVGDGVVDFTSIYAQRKLSGLKYGYVEQEAYTMPEEECIKRSIEYMKKKKWYNV
ncbi:MAG: sugar phosphate isomerase/epimerase family protein [Chitinophagaceae bacterium]